MGARGTYHCPGVGFEDFEALLAGGRFMDEQFRSAALEGNIPMQGALMDFWYFTLLGYRAHGIVPYDQRLCYVPPYLQQLMMESNGKGVGSPGTEGFLPHFTHYLGRGGNRRATRLFSTSPPGSSHRPLRFYFGGQGLPSPRYPRRLGPCPRPGARKIPPYGTGGGRRGVGPPQAYGGRPPQHNDHHQGTLSF